MPWTPNSRTTRALLRLGAGALLVATFGVASAGSVEATGVTFVNASVGAFRGFLAAPGAGSLYMLYGEKGPVLRCTSAACLATWHPVLVATSASASSVTLGTGVHGTIRFIARSATTKQVVFNGFPVYTYSGDRGQVGTKGEAVPSKEGRWYLLHAAPNPASAVPIHASLQLAFPSPTFEKILEQGSYARTMYVLSSERGGRLTCTGGCLGIWPPLLVPKSTTSIAIGGGVEGTIGFVNRGTMKQVTLNSYPVYTYSGDSGAGQCNGQQIVAFGGTWYVASAVSTTAAGEPHVAGTCSAPIYP